MDIYYLKGNAVKAFILLSVAIACLLFAPLSPLWAQDVDIDFIAPNIEYRPFFEAVYASKQIEIAVKITDAKGIQEANLFYRPAGKEGFLKIKMTARSNDIYSAVIPGEAVFEPRMDYYFEATETSGNTKRKGSMQFPLTVSVVAAIPIPSQEDLTKNKTIIEEEKKIDYPKYGALDSLKKWPSEKHCVNVSTILEVIGGGMVGYAIGHDENGHQFRFQEKNMAIGTTWALLGVLINNSPIKCQLAAIMLGTVGGFTIGSPDFDTKK